MKLSFTVQPQQALRLDLFLKRNGFSTSLIRSIKYNEKSFEVNGERVRTNHLLSAGEIVIIYLPPDDERELLPPQDIPFNIVWQGKHCVVVEKPAGIVMHPTLSHAGGTFANAFMNWLEKERLSLRPFRPIGRLDGGTSGLVLCAMNAYAAPILSESLIKRYFAVVTGKLHCGNGEIVAPITPCSDSVIKQCVDSTGKFAKTVYRLLGTGKTSSLLEVATETGRTHQIRVHFSHIGHPLVGDYLYGEESRLINRHALHCSKIFFKEPGDAGKEITSPLPADMQEFMQADGYKCVKSI